MDLGNFRPTTLAAMAADLEIALEDGDGDMTLDLEYQTILQQLIALVGKDDTDRLIENAAAEA